jgi:hypothetical protein
MTPSEKRIYGRTAILFPLSRRGVKWFGYRRWLSLLQKVRLPMAAISPDETQTVQRTIALMRQRHGQRLNAGYCLPRTLTLWWLLKQQNITATIHFGIRNDHAFDAHAWLTHQQHILFDLSQEVEQFVEIYQSNQ